MQHLNPDNARLYPRLDRLLHGLELAERELTSLLELYSGLSESEVLSALQWGTAPRIAVGNLVNASPNALAHTPHRGGANRTTNIILARFMIDELERPSALSELDGIRLVEATVLHELVHWGRFEKGLPVLIDGQEAGKVFECAYYHSDVTWYRGDRQLTYSCGTAEFQCGICLR